LFYVSFVCLHVCAYAFKIKVHCWSAFEPGASVLPCYCTPPVCVPDVIGALAVWRQNNQKNKDMRLAVCFFGVTNSCIRLQNRNLVKSSFLGDTKLDRYVPPTHWYVAAYAPTTHLLLQNLHFCIQPTYLTSYAPLLSEPTYQQTTNTPT